VDREHDRLSCQSNIEISHDGVGPISSPVYLNNTFVGKACRTPSPGK